MVRWLVLLGCAVLLAGGAWSCARVFPPAGPPEGPRPASEVQPPSAVHGLAALHGDCLSCHGKDDRFLVSLRTVHPVPAPPGFVGSVQQACQLCHQMEPEHGLARTMPHPVAGWEACRACHTSGMPGIKQMPPNHGSYSVARCTECHELGGNADIGLLALPQIGR